MMFRGLIFLLFVLTSTLHAAQPLDRSLQAPVNLVASSPTNDGGTRIKLEWEMPNKWPFYILDGDRQIGVVEYDKRHYTFTGEIEDVYEDEEDRLQAQRESTDELGQRLRVLWVNPEKLPKVANTSDIERAGQLVETKLELGPTGKLSWKIPSDSFRLTLFRSEDGLKGPWEPVKIGIKGSERTYTDTVTENPKDNPPKEKYWYFIGALPKEYSKTKSDSIYDDYLNYGEKSATVIGIPKANWFKNSKGIYVLIFLILTVGWLMFHYSAKARLGIKMPIRRIPGIDAIEEGIGRATEMGKPVLYIPGINSLDDIQTIASILVLGEIAKTIAEYQTDIIVSCKEPIVREVADEMVMAGFYRAGHPDAFDPTSVRFISSEQFAFCAGTNGIMYRQKPATNIYLGCFYAESLILAETGFVNGAIQIAGTAEASQLPFFIAACDYTLIGEELFAVSAYLSGDHQLVSSLKASDTIKLGIVAVLAIGVVVMSLGYNALLTWFTIS